MRFKHWKRETMKILLTTLNSKYVHMNLALRYLYEAAAEYRSEIELKEFTINNVEDYIFMELVSGEHDLICFSCYIWNMEQILTLAENLKKARPEVKIVLGGPEVSFDREEVLEKYRFIDGVIAGEGEKAFVRLCAAFLEDGRIVTNEKAEMLSPEDIPFPYKTLEPEPDKTVYYESARGCPYSCSYCLSSIDRCIRALPLDRVKKELEYFLDRKVRQVKFIDRTFNWNDERCCDIIQFIMDKDKGITNFHMEMCAELISPKLLAILKCARKGLFQFEIGIQSTNRDTIKAVNRTGDFEKARKNIEQIVREGRIHLHLDLIAGLPLEGYESFKNSFRQVYSLNAEELQLGFLKMLKGTQLKEETETHGYLVREKPPYEFIANKYISAAEVVALKRVENLLDLYHNKGGFERAIQQFINKKQGDSFAFYEALANYFYTKGHQHKSHKKEDLYRILLGYGEAEGMASQEIKEMLLIDMKDTLNSEAVKNFERKGFNAL